MFVKSLAKNYSPKNFTVAQVNTENCVQVKIKIGLQINDGISVLWIAASSFKWNPLWH